MKINYIRLFEIVTFKHKDRIHPPEAHSIIAEGTGIGKEGNEDKKPGTMSAKPIKAVSGHKPTLHRMRLEQIVKRQFATSVCQRRTPVIRMRSLATFVFLAALSASMIHAQELRGYRGFQFGTNLVAVAKQTHLKPSEAKLLHQRPAMIQELWSYRPLGSSPLAMDPVREIVFSFYNGELFRMVINYDQDRTNGLTDEDMIEAISARYGTAARPVATVVLFSSSQVYNDSQKVIARWEDAQYSFNLFRYLYQPAFGMVAFSKQLDTLAQAAVVEAFRLDKEEAPQREMERQKKEDAENRAAQEKARSVNKPAFLP